MEPADEPDETIYNLRKKLTDILEADVDGLFNDLSPLFLLSLEDHVELSESDSPEEKREMIINALLQKGERFCETILSHLEIMIPRSQDASDEKMNAFSEMMLQFKVKDDRISKLTLKNILDIGHENIEDVDPQTVEEIPWHFIRKLMALNRNGRKTQVKRPQKEKKLQAMYDDFDSDDDDDENYLSGSFHPLDILCFVLHCSDVFLQQEILVKMSMCQFAIPLLLTAGDGPNCTFMLWAMRDIVKRWRPISLVKSKGFMEDNLVNISMPTFSFVRLGKSKLSKSKILNTIISPSGQYHDFFIHDNMECGNIQRKISDGLVEASWYFPVGKENSDNFPVPIAVTNLRGNLESNWKQFSFLTQVSTAVFIFVDNISENEFLLLSQCSNSDAKFYFIISPSHGKPVNRQTLKTLKQLFPVLKIDTRNVLKKDNTSNDAELTNNIKVIITAILENSPKRIKLEDMSDTAYELGILVDESSSECQDAEKCAIEITEEIRDVSLYKTQTMKLQGDLWKQVSQIEKEMCRRKKQGDRNGEEYKSQLRQRHVELHKLQNQHDLPNGMVKFISAITNLSYKKKHYFLKSMAFKLDAITRQKMSTLKAEYKKKLKNGTNNQQELDQLDKKIFASSLGVQNFMRELGQFYEAEWSMVQEKIITRKERQFTKIPGISADLLLDGFPLELIDGDASNVPMRWITDVLTELDNKTGGGCRLRVITVLGVQSTGKSTLLNTMFGLQFPVASGRCTRGAFMTLIKVKENFKDELGCEFILVIDTEGLKAPEMASLDDSYEHDNELATLVIGLSDITIINMAMENIAEMKDTLQIVVHAFLRMKEIEKKPSCHFVHQNVSDVSAHDNIMRDRKKLLEQLDEMTKAAAKMEKKSGITSFSDVMGYDFEKNNWYIPGLWQGVPPMATINHGYSENVYELKKCLFDFIKTNQYSNRPQTMSDFIKWVQFVWNAVKYEKFIFNFRNSLVADAYNQLSVKNSQWEWTLCKHVHNWLTQTETKIKNISPDNLTNENCAQFKEELQQVLRDEGKKMSDLLEKYFEEGSENVQLIERYKEDFFRSAIFLKKELERDALNKFEEAVRIHKEKHKVHCIQSHCLKLIEEEVTNLLETYRKNDFKLSFSEIKSEFEKVWEKTISDLQIRALEKRDVSQAMLQLLRNEMSCKGASLNEAILNVKGLAEYGQLDFQMDTKYIDTTWLSLKCNKVYVSPDYYDKIHDLADLIIDTCNMYVRQKVASKRDYDDTYSKELLHMINERLQEKSVSKMHISSLFELEIKFLVFGRAASMFQKMHDDFVQENDPRNCLETFRPQYLSTFEKMLHEKDDCQHRARCFTDVCLKPAITEYIFKHLGKEIMEDILNGCGSLKFCNRTFFQFSVLEELLTKNDFRQYVEYINKYETYVKNWIVNFISSQYEELSCLKILQENILTPIVKKIKEALNNTKSLKSPTVSTFLQNVCQMLSNDLVISKNETKAILFHNKANVKQFSTDIQFFLTEVQEKILADIKLLNIKTILSKVALKPQDELFKRLIGCGKQCPFCKVPCEAGATDHKEHFSSVHRPQGLGRYRWNKTADLVPTICSTHVFSEGSFLNSDTNGKFHPYKDYRAIYPDWAIQPDPSIKSSDYWNFIFTQFNEQFAKEYNAKPAKLPEGWQDITTNEALIGLREIFCMKLE
ncbi:up-regulator of cell proliferation [Bombina bombina]|uniref:up-regulator of cell proliferation n=1 Tax=Bombina bombina TaxID=8345 RepID=UPI00235AE17B|nr:up-regulator of cell proliferation [Bombina bombina]XP_053550716.1 up-regulator of cell proliferation [Bombina bombina]XP_053550717.1 up-regulator of cell proliferation [Bombina bombina]